MARRDRATGRLDVEPGGPRHHSGGGPRSCRRVNPGQPSSRRLRAIHHVDDPLPRATDRLRRHATAPTGTGSPTRETHDQAVESKVNRWSDVGGCGCEAVDDRYAARGRPAACSTSPWRARLCTAISSMGAAGRGSCGWTAATRTGCRWACRSWTTIVDGSDAPQSRSGFAGAFAQEHAQGVGVLIADSPGDGFQGQFGGAQQVGCPFDPQVLDEADG
jgi:hypothetical protein